ncbi:zinc knuckle CX2CX4HX4C containing protein [Tanacetum coccineum]
MKGEINFASCLNEVKADEVLKDSITMGVPLPKDGFQTVVNKRKSGKTCSTNTNRSGVTVGKATWQPIKPKIIFEPKAHGNLPKNGAPNVSIYAKDGPSIVLTSSKEQPAKVCKSGGGKNILDMDDTVARRRRLAGKESLKMFRSNTNLGMKSGLGSHLPRRDARLDKNTSVDSMLNEVAGVNSTTRGGECDDSNLVGNQFTRLCDLTSGNINVTSFSNNDSRHAATLFNNEQLLLLIMVAGSESKSTPCVLTMSTGGEVNVNESIGMGRFYSKSSNTSLTSIAIGFFTSKNGVSKGFSGFASRVDGGATPGNDTPFASKPADVEIRESSRSLLEEVMLERSNQEATLESDMHGAGQKYDGVDMESTKSILEEISLDKYDELVARMSTVDHKTYSEVIQILVEKFVDPNKPTGAEIPCSDCNINECKVVGANAASNVQTTFNKATSVSFAGAASSSLSEPKRGKSNFRSLVSKNVCEGVELLIPMNAVETISNRLKTVIMNSKGFFFFKFDSKKGLEDVLENGPWMIRNILIILKKWMMNTSTLKEEFTRIPRRNRFARCLIEFNADTVLKESITMGIPLLDGPSFSKEMNAMTIPTVDMTNDGFQVVLNKRKSSKTGSTTNRSSVDVAAYQFEDGSKPSSSFFSAYSKMGGRKAPTNSSNILTSNPYDLLSQEFDPENYTRSGCDPNLVQDDMESEEEVEVVFNETTNLLSSSITGASTYTAPDFDLENYSRSGGDPNVSNDMESEEEFEVVLDETVNLLKSTKTEASTYTALDVFKT